MVKRLCNQTGVDSYFTNHSLRRTHATRLFQQGIEEQQIMSITGLRSSNAVRIYKEISHEQEQQLSNLIQPVKKYKIEEEGDKQGSTTVEPTGPTTTPVFNFKSCSVIINNK